MKSCIWRFAGVSLLCLSVSAQALAEGESDEDRQRAEEQHKHQQEQQHQQQNQPQNQQQQNQQHQQQEQQRQQQQSQQQHQQQQQQQEQQRQQQSQQRQQQVQQQQEQQRQQQQTQQRLPIQPRPDEVRQTQQPRQGNFQENPRQANNQNQHWQGGPPPRPGGGDGRPGNDRWQGRPDGHGNGWGPGPQHRPGFVIDQMPSEHSRYGWHGQDYFYSGGYWYRPQGPRYVIVQPPFGIRVHDLPSYSQEVWLGGALFFVAAGTYYMYQQDTQDYVVTEPPQGAEPYYPAGPPPEPAPVQAPPFNISYDPRFSPVNGQGQDQMNQDGYDCHMYAVNQSRFDPSAAAYAPSQQVVDYYRQAMSNCLASRGYSVSY